MSDTVSLPLRAENNAKFYSRFKWLGLGALLFMGWSLYDAMLNYPDQMERGQALIELAEETLPSAKLEELSQASHGGHDLYQKVLKQVPDFPELKEAWEAKAAEEGWPAQPYKKLRTQGDILQNYIMAIAGGCAGVWFLLTVVRTNGRWFELNENGITSRWGESFALDQVTAIDKKQWRDKGIARVRYRDAKGRSRTFVVDNYKYHKKTTDRIFYRIEQAAGPEKIHGGKPDADPDAVIKPTRESIETTEG